MATGNTILTSLNNASVAPTEGTAEVAIVSFGSSGVLQACSNLYLEVFLSDPTNEGAAATFEVQIVGGIQSTDNLLGSPITETGLNTVTASSPFTTWQANLVSLSGGTAPTITVRGVAGE
jgi:hypothetical protein